MPILRRLRRVRMIVDIVECDFWLEVREPGCNNNGEVHRLGVRVN